MDSVRSSPLASEKQIKLKIDIAPELPQRRSDERRLLDTNAKCLCATNVGSLRVGRRMNESPLSRKGRAFPNPDTLLGGSALLRVKLLDRLCEQALFRASLNPD